MSGQVPDIREGFADLLDREIVIRGWTNDETARAVGTTEKQIRRWRKGQHAPSLRNCRRVREALGLDKERRESA